MSEVVPGKAAIETTIEEDKQMQDNPMRDETHTRGSVIVARHANPRMLRHQHTMFEQVIKSPEEQQKLEQMVDHYDADADGKFTRAEVKQIVKDKMFEHFVAEERGRTAKRVAESLQKFQYKNRALKFSILAGAIVVALLAGLMAITNEAQKETHVNTRLSTLLSNGGNTVGTANVKQEVSLEALPTLGSAALAALEEISYPTDEAGRILYLKVSL